jgi:hypothetical protein
MIEYITMGNIEDWWDSLADEQKEEIYRKMQPIYDRRAT